MSSTTSAGEAKKVALEALNANKAEQHKLHEYILRLQASLDAADALIAEVEKHSAKEKELVDVEEDVELKCIEVKGAVKVKILTKFWNNPESPFYNDAMKRQRYLGLTKIRPWSSVERQYLKQVVVNEHKRLYALDLKARGHHDILNAVRALDDFSFESSDASSLDWTTVSNKLSSMFPPSHTARTALDCKVQWLGSDHPKINKGPWTDDELAALSNAVAEERLLSQEGEAAEDEPEEGSVPKVNWSAVSERLGGTRTPVQCLQRCLTHGVDYVAPSADGNENPPHAEVGTSDMVPFIDGEQPASVSESHVGTPTAPPGPLPIPKKSTKGSKSGAPVWTPEEDEILLETVRLYGALNWSLVASMLPFPRSARQCSDRYRLSLDPNIRRARWTVDEDERLKKAVESLGTKWQLVKDYVKGRTGAQCRERWCNVVDPSLKRADWTPKEDEQILALRASGKEWPVIAKAIGGRTDNQVWRRYKILQKEPGASKSPSKAKGTARKSTKWSTEEDERLLEAKTEGATWDAIADAIGGGRTSQQCSNRWKLLRKAQANRKNENADAELLETLTPISDNDDEARVAKTTPKPRPRPRPRARLQKRTEDDEQDNDAAASSSKPSRKRKRDANEPRDDAADVIAEEGAEVTLQVEPTGIRSRLRKRQKVDYAAAVHDEDGLDVKRKGKRTDALPAKAKSTPSKGKKAIKPNPAENDNEEEFEVEQRAEP